MKPKDIGLLLLFCCFLMLNCKKKQPEALPAATPNSSTQFAFFTYEDMGSLYYYQDAEVVSMSLLKMGLEISETGSLAIAPCANITKGVKSFTVDFGVVCLGADLRRRKGVLVYDYSTSLNGATSFKMPGFCFKITGINYSEGGVSVDIHNKVIRNISHSIITGQKTFNGLNLMWVDSNSLSCIVFNSGAKLWNCVKTIMLTNSNDTTCYKGQYAALDINRAKLLINAVAFGTFTDADNAGNITLDSFTCTAHDLYFDFTCEYDAFNKTYTGGCFYLKPASQSLRNVNYGYGVCDGTCTISFGNSAPQVYGGL